MADAQNIRREKWERQDRQQDAGSCGESRVDVARTDEGHMADTRYDESQGWVAGQDTSAGASAGNSTWNEPASCRISYGDSHMADANDTERRQDGAGGDDDHRDQAGRDEDAGDIGACNEGDMADADHQRCDGIDTLLRQGEAGRVEGDFHEASGRCSTNSFWSDHIWLTGADGKSRRSKSGLPLLAHGIPNRVGRLRAYGNAIVAQVAAEVIMAFAEAQEPA
jgi:DNA (cytosine-5)-methyltransferase 1